MAFELAHSNKNGSFKIQLNREVSQEEIMQLCQLATNLIPCVMSDSSVAGPMNGPYLPSQSSQGNDQHVLSSKQSRLGEKPVSSINMGSYVEPSSGVRIKMLHMIETGLVPALKCFRETTNISITGCKEILFGNYRCPILTIKDAQNILEKFRSLNIFAKIVSSSYDDSLEGA